MLRMYKTESGDAYEGTPKQQKRKAVADYREFKDDNGVASEVILWWLTQVEDKTRFFTVKELESLIEDIGVDAQNRCKYLSLLDN